MSWGIQRMGTKAAVATACAADLDRCAKSYEGQEEQRDIWAAKDRIAAAIAGIDTTPDAVAKVYGIRVSASGSASKYSMSLQIQVDKIALELD